MSKSVRGYTDFTAKVNSVERIARQNSRLRPTGILRLLLVCTLLSVLPSVSFAQTGIPVAINWDGSYGWTEGGILSGYVDGQGIGGGSQPGYLEVRGSLDVFMGQISNLTCLSVWDNLTYLGGNVQNVGTITANNVAISGMLNGGFQVLSAKPGQGRLSVSGGLVIDPGAIASGYSVQIGTEYYRDGIIVNNGILNSETTIYNYGDIINNGVISSYNDFRNYGTIEGNGIVSIGANRSTPGSNHQFLNTSSGTIAGGLVINGDFSSYGTIAPQMNGDIIRITNGQATIYGGTVDPSAYINAEIGKQYPFLMTDHPGDLMIMSGLKAAGSGQTGSVLDFTPFFGSWNGNRYVRGEQWLPSNQYYWLEVGRAYSYGAHGVSLNQKAVGEYIDLISSAPKQGSGLWNLLVQLDGVSDNPAHPYYHPDYKEHQGKINPAALKALNELAGMSYANLGVISVHNVGMVNRSLGDVLRSDVFKFSRIGNPNNAIRGQAIAPLRYSRWGTLFGIGGTSANDRNASGYKTSFGGVMAGVDRSLWTGLRVGGWLSAATGDARMSNVSEKSDITNVMVGLYFRQEMYYGYGLASFGFGADNYKTKRYLTMTGHRAESKFDGNIGTMYLERGIDIPVLYATVQPYTSFQVVSIDQERFRETMWNELGQYTQTGLEGLKHRTDSYRMALGARASTTPVPMRWGQVAFTTNTAWFHDFNRQKDWGYVARFSNPGGANFTGNSDATFRVFGNNPKQDWINFGVGLNIDRNSTRFFLATDLYGNSRQTLFSGSGGIVTSW